MSSTNDNLLTIIKCQQEKLDAMIKQNGQLTEELAKLKPPARGNNNHHGNNKRIREQERDKDNKPDNKNPSLPKCPICGLRSHPINECWELDSNTDKRPDGWKSIRKE